MRILGISAFYHDSAAALVIDGEIIAAAQEERFTRIKHDASLPRKAVEYCLTAGNLNMADIDAVAFYDKPFLKFERLLETYLATAPFGFTTFHRSLPLWIKEKLFQKHTIISELKALNPNLDWQKKILFSEHHLSHAASAFYPSPFAAAAVLTMDGVGEWTTTSLSIGEGSKLEIQKEIHFPHSIGLLYSAFTYFLGFKVNSGEYKVMGLAPYGEPKYTNQIYDNLIDLKADGSFRLNLKYFDYCTGLQMTNAHFARLFGTRERTPEAPLEQVHLDLAASIQAVTEEIVLRLGKTAAKESKKNNICLAGGVALNCVANGKLLRSGIFENIWIQPAAGDAGGALGAALAAEHLHFGGKRSVENAKSMHGSYLGPSYTNDEVRERLEKLGAIFTPLDEAILLKRTALALNNGKAVGWMQGRMEFGPRALGNRSILADPRSPSMQKDLNLKIKFRESFRPFAPAVLEEFASEWFELAGPSPYMLLVASLAEKHRLAQANQDQHPPLGIDLLKIERSSIPAVTHVDYSARLQTVSRETNPKFHKLISEFHALTNCPMLVNTSFNIRGEPIVESPEDAFRCFMGTGLDVLVVGDCYLEKSAQARELARDYKQEFLLD